MLLDWLKFAGAFLLLAGTGTRSYVLQSVVDDATEEEIKHGYNMASLFKYFKNIFFIQLPENTPTLF